MAFPPLVPMNFGELPRLGLTSGAERTALTGRTGGRSYAALCDEISAVADGFLGLGLPRQGRVAVWLEKRCETVVAIFAAGYAGGVAVPINPILKPRQVGHILADCGVTVLVTSTDRLRLLGPVLKDCPSLSRVVIVGAPLVSPETGCLPPTVLWAEIVASSSAARHPVIDTDMALIFYTSGSTGSPKGVVLSHRNVIAGAHSVNLYLEHTGDDRLLAVLPLSFDAGFSQLTTAFAVGARVVLLNYLSPQDVVRAVIEERISGITAVPPLWHQLVAQTWPDGATTTLRYLANTGGHLPRPLLDRLRGLLPEAQIYLMYGLTEAFRSTYLPPAELDRRPNSIGRAIPNTEIMVLRPDGSRCAPNETGELVHRGATVAMGYWNDTVGTAARFRPVAHEDRAIPSSERCVWSGDLVRRDEEGFLYFVGRDDDMIKASGYRVSPTEIEEAILRSGEIGEVVALGLADPTTGQAVAVAVTPAQVGEEVSVIALQAFCRAELPAYMVPRHYVVLEALPRGPNGKIDRPWVRHYVENAVGTGVASEAAT